jgi:hypothetical protein
MAFQNFNKLYYFIIGAVAGVISFIVSFLFSVIPIPKYYVSNEIVSFTAAVVDINFRDQLLSSGNVTAVWEAFKNATGALGFNWTAFFGVVLGFGLLALGGRFIVGFIKPNKFTDKIKTILSFGIGAAVFAIIFALYFKLNFFSYLFSTIVFGLVIGIIMQLLLRTKTLKKFAE